MGTYSGFLLLEDLFDNLPEESAALYNEAQSIFDPKVKIVSNDCGTLLGKSVSLDFSCIGFWDLASDGRLTKAQIEYYLSQGQYTRFIRHPAYCIAKGGVCKKCHDAWRISQQACRVGTLAEFPSEVITGEQTHILAPDENAVVIQTDIDEYDRMDVFFNDEFTTAYVVTETEDGKLRVNISGPVAAGDVVFIRLFRNTASPFMSYLSETYAGNLLGAAPLQTGDLPIRVGLLKETLSEAKLNSMAGSLEAYAEYIPGTFQEYATKIRDPLERALFMLALYGVFYDVGV